MKPAAGAAMVDAIQTARLFHRTLFVGIALVFLFLRLLPLGGDAGDWPAPDLLLGFACAWVLRRPDYVPAVLVGLVFLTDDFLSQRPPGLWAALALVAVEFLRRREPLMRGLPFAVEWVAVGAVLTAMLLGYRLAMALAILPQPDLRMAVLQLVTTIAIYPLVVAVSRFGLRLRRPPTGQIDVVRRQL